MSNHHITLPKSVKRLLAAMSNTTAKNAFKQMMLDAERASLQIRSRRIDTESEKNSND